MIQNTALYFSDGLSFTLEAKSRWKIKKELVGFLAGYCPACLVLGWVPCVYPAGLALGGIVWHHHCLVSTRLGRMALPSLLSTRLGSMARSSWLSIRRDSMASSLTVSTRLGRMALPSLLSTRLGRMVLSSWLS